MCHVVVVVNILAVHTHCNDTPGVILVYTIIVYYDTFIQTLVNRYIFCVLPKSCLYHQNTHFQSLFNVYYQQAMLCIFYSTIPHNTNIFFLSITQLFSAVRQITINILMHNLRYRPVTLLHIHILYTNSTFICTIIHCKSQLPFSLDLCKCVLHETISVWGKVTQIEFLMDNASRSLLAHEYLDAHTLLAYSYCLYHVCCTRQLWFAKLRKWVLNGLKNFFYNIQYL